VKLLTILLIDIISIEKHWMSNLDLIHFIVLTGFSRLRNSLWSFPRTGAVKWWTASLACTASKSSYSSLQKKNWLYQTCQNANPIQKDWGIILALNTLYVKRTRLNIETEQYGSVGKKTVDIYLPETKQMHSSWNGTLIVWKWTDFLFIKMFKS